MPDFGYDGDNFVIDRSEDAPRNWKLLTDFVYNKDKYEWLQNHLLLRKIRQQQVEEDEKKRAHLVSKKQQKEKDQPDAEKINRCMFTVKEMEAIEEIKRTLTQQGQFMAKFKQMNATMKKERRPAPFGIVQPKTELPLTTTNAARRTLIERQKDHLAMKKPRASLSPEQLRKLDLRSSK